MANQLISRFIFPGFLSALLLAATDAWGAAKYYSTTAGALNWANIGGSSLWSTTSGGTYNQAWASGDSAVLEGTGGPITISGTVTTTYGTTTTGGLNITADGYSVSASSAQTLNVGNASQASFITVASGKTATIGNYVKLTKATTGHSELDVYGGGTLVIGSGLGTLGTSGALLDLSATAPTTGNNAYIGGGSTLNIASDGTAKYYGGLLVGGIQGGGSSGNATVIVNGALAVGTGSGTTAGSIILGYDNSQTASATVTLNSGGTITTTKTSGGLRFGFTSAGGSWTRTFNLNGGTLTVNQIYVNVAGASSVFNFNGGTLKPLANNTTFMTGLTTANVRNGGAIIDAAGKAITIGQALVHSTLGDNAIDGGLTLNDSVGGGTLTLNNTETYTGPTVVAAGTLALGASGALNAGSTIGIAPGATFDVSALTTFTFGSSSSLLATGSVSSASFIKGGSGSPGISLNSRPATLQFAPTGFLGDSTHPALTVTAGTLSIGGSTITVVNNGGSPLGAGDYTLINVSGGGAISGTPTLDSVTGVGAGTGMAANTSATLVSISGSLVLHVTSSLATTTTTIALHSGWSSTSTYGDALQFDVSVTGSTPTGTVTVRDGGSGGTAIGSGTLSGGTATITVNPLTSLAAGSHNNIVAVYSGDVNNQGSFSSPLGTQTVNQKPLTISGAAAVGKCYDGTTSAVLSGGSLVGVVSGDSANLTFNLSGAFVSAGPGTAIGITGTSTLSGSSSGNYSLTAQPTGLTADIVTTATWNIASGGTWEPAGNWLNSIVGTASGNTADFSTVNITADATVTLSSTRTIGNLVFGDTDTSTAAGWTLTGSTLTMAGTTPTITVNTLGTGKSAIISSIIAGSSGLTKTGNGTLALSTAVNTYSGGTKINGGTLSIGADARLGVVPGSLDPQNIVIDGGKLYLNSGSLVTSANRGVQINSGNATLDGVSGNIGIGGPISGVGALTNATTTAQLVTGVYQHTYAGGTTLLPGSSIVPQTTSDGTGVNLTKGPFGTGILTLAGGSFRAGAGGGPYDFGNAVTFAADTTINASGLAFILSGPVTLTGNRTLTQNSANSVTISGSIGEDVAGRGLTKAGTGAGALILTAANSYSGATTISAGTLALSGSGSLAAGSGISIAAGATFDVSALTATTYMLGASAGLSASGTASAATIKGNTIVNLGSRPVTLTYDGSHPALTVSQGALTIGGNQFTVNGAALTSGTYSIATVTGGSITDGGNYPDVVGTAIDSTHYGRISVSGGNINLTVALKPTVTGKTYLRAPGVSYKIFASDLAATATVDASLGYTATFDHCDATTANIVTLGNNGQNGNSAVFIYPGNAANASDSFSYTIGDGHGGSVSGTVTITIDNNVTGQGNATITFSGNTATINYFGLPGYHYVVQKASAAEGPYSDYTGVTSPEASIVNGVITAPAAGAFTIVDSNASSGSAFYKLRAAP